MPKQPGSKDHLFATRWVHLYEQDSPKGEVYAPEDNAIPLSRRPRERLELKADGSATVFVGGADDRPVPRPARWTEEGDRIVLTPTSGEPARRIVEHSATRLVVTR